MSRRFNNNEGCIVRPIGRPGTSFGIVPDLILLDERLSHRARIVIGYVAGRPIGWIVTIEDLKRQLGLSGSAWQRVRDELRSVGIIPRNHPIRLGGGRNQFTWVLNIDLAQYYLSAPSPSLGDGVIHNPSPGLGDGSHRPPAIDGGRVINNRNSSTSPPSRARAREVVGGGNQVDQKDEDALALADVLAAATAAGLGPGAARRCASAAAGASPAQRELLKLALAGGLSGANDRAALAVYLSKVAARGGLETTSGSGPASEGGMSQEFQSRERLKTLAGGRITSPTGEVWSVEDGGQVRLAGPGLILHPAAAARLLERLNAGELDYSPSR